MAKHSFTINEPFIKSFTDLRSKSPPSINGLEILRIRDGEGGLKLLHLALAKIAVGEGLILSGQWLVHGWWLVLMAVDGRLNGELWSLLQVIMVFM